MAIIGCIVAFMLFRHYMRHLRQLSRQLGEDRKDDARACGWHGHRDWERSRRRAERDARRWARRFGYPTAESAPPPPGPTTPSPEEQIQRRARRRAAAEVGFYTHLAELPRRHRVPRADQRCSRPGTRGSSGRRSAGASASSRTTWASSARAWLRERYFEPAVEREVRREKAVDADREAGRASTSSRRRSRTRSATRSPPPRAWCSRWARTRRRSRTSSTRKVALEELDRVERRISHLLKYAKEEDYQLRAGEPRRGRRLGADRRCAPSSTPRRCAVARNYITGPTVVADAEKLRQVFANILDNAIDALAAVAEGRRIDLFIENGGRQRHGPRARQRLRHPAGQDRPHLQPVLHHQGEGHRPRHGDLEEDRRGARGHDRRRERGGPRHRVRGDAAAARRSDASCRAASWSSTTRRRCCVALQGPARQGGLPGRDGAERRGGAAAASRPAASTSSSPISAWTASSGMQVLEHARARRPGPGRRHDHRLRLGEDRRRRR